MFIYLSNIFAFLTFYRVNSTTIKIGRLNILNNWYAIIFPTHYFNSY